jgi:hypothetical protein
MRRAPETYGTAGYVQLPSNAIENVQSPPTAFDATLALEDQTFAGLLDGEDPCALYDEYVRGFDDVPTLTDPVALPPPRLVPPEFRLGERKDIRKRAREDAATLRETNAREQAHLYDEYLEPSAKKPKRGKRRKKRQRRSK